MNDDLISRQAAIEAYGDWYVEDGTEEGFIGTVKQLLEGLPSAQPATNCSEIPNSSDAISRQQAIDALKRISFSHWFECGEYLSEDTREIEIINSSKALETIEVLPSAQPDARLKKIADLVEGTIDHFDRDDAMDLLYQIKEVLKNE